MNKVWFTSDLHFSHKNIVKFTNRGVETDVEHHNEWLTDMWNSTVHRSDTVYHLGDLSFNKNQDETVKWLNSLNGNKILLKGNHDRSDAFKAYSYARNTFCFPYLEKKFTLSDETKQDIVLFHFPILSFHKQSHGSWHLHGHSHGNLLDSKGNILDVGIDSAYNLYGKHKFFDLDMIQEFMKSRDTYVADSHRENL